MAQVPYVPYSTAQPTSPGEQVSVNTPDAAFGVNIGEGIRRLGGQMETSGGEVFQRAIALQDLDNENKSRDGVAEFSKQQALLHANFIADHPGVSAREALPAFLQQSDDLRTKIRASMPNDAARRMYDAESTGFMLRNINSAALHAGEAYRQGTIKSIDSAAALVADQVTDPNNEAELQAKTNRLHQLGLQRKSAADMTDADVAEWERTHTSRAAKSQSVTMGFENVLKAYDWLEAHKGQMKVEDYDDAKNRLMIDNRAQGGSYIADKVWDPKKSLQQMEDDARAMAPQYARKDPEFMQSAIRAVQSNYLIHERAVTQANRTNLGKVEAAIMQTNPRQLDDLNANPDTRATIAALPPEMQKQIPGMITQWQTTRFKTSRNDNFIQLWGQANSPDPEEREKFLDTNLMTQQVGTTGQMAQLITKKAQMMKNPEIEDPHIGKAISWLSQGGATAGWMRAIGLNKTQNPDQWNKFVGSMEQAISLWREDNGKPPSYKDVKETIGPQLLQQLYHEPGVLNYFQRNEALFERSPPQDFIDQTNQRAIGKGEKLPDEQEMYQAWQKSEWIRLYNKSKQTTSKPTQ